MKDERHKLEQLLVPPPLRFSRFRDARNYAEQKFFLWCLSNRARRHTTVKRAAQMLEMLSLRNTSYVLDEGAAWGYAALQLARKGHKVVAFDKISDHLEIARQLADYNGLRIQCICGDARQKPFRDAQFDAVVQMECIEHVGKDWARAIEEISRVLKPGGRVVISTPNPRGLAQRVKKIAAKLPVLSRKWGGEDFIEASDIINAGQRYGLTPLARRTVIFTVPFLLNRLFPLNQLFEMVAEESIRLRKFATTSIFLFRKLRSSASPHRANGEVT